MGFPHFSSSCNKHHDLVRDFAKKPRPEIICLCGSTKFYDKFQEANFQQTMAGKIVLSVGFYPHAEGQFVNKVHGETVGVTPEQKEALDELHKRKIDLADSIFVLNNGGYTGSSTRSEIDYAEKLGKPIKYLEFCTECWEPYQINDDGHCRICGEQTLIYHFPNGSAAYSPQGCCTDQL
jgi:hypothetical protein